MKILSIETTSETGSISFLEEGAIKSEVTFVSHDIAAELTGYADGILMSSGCSPRELDLIVISRGPGLWTGIRLGMGFAKGIASANNTAIYCVDTAGSIFYGIRELGMASLCLVNAYRERMHVSFFNGRFSWSSPYPVQTLTFDNLYEFCRKKKLYLTGPGTSVLPREIRKLKTVTVSSAYLSVPRAGLNALLAAEKLRRKIGSLPLEPFYGR